MTGLLDLTHCNITARRRQTTHDVASDDHLPDPTKAKSIEPSLPHCSPCARDDGGTLDSLIASCCKSFEL